MRLSKPLAGLITLYISLAGAQDAEPTSDDSPAGNGTSGSESAALSPNGSDISPDASSYVFVNWGTAYGWYADAYETGACYRRSNGQTRLNDWYQYGGKAGCGVPECLIWSNNGGCSGSSDMQVTGTTHLDNPRKNFWSWKCSYK